MVENTHNPPGFQGIDENKENQIKSIKIWNNFLFF